MPGERSSGGSRLGADRRLASKRDFERLLRSGIRRNRHGYTFYLAARPDGPARLGILVSKKHSTRAVVRNGLKRCVREAFRMEHANLGRFDLLVRPPFGARPGARMLVRLRELFVELARQGAA